MRYEILSFDDFLEVRTYGNAELQGFKDFIQAFVTHKDWRTGGALLVNHSELNAASLTNNEISEMADFTKPFLPQIGRAKIALLVMRDLEYGMGRVWQVFASEGRESVSGIFRSREEAISWLKEK